VVEWFFWSNSAIGLAAISAWPVGFALIRDKDRIKRLNFALLPYQIIGFVISFIYLLNTCLVHLLSRTHPGTVSY
jgi:hypothetical protein